MKNARTKPRVVIVPKLSKLEWDKRRLNVSQDEMVEIYHKQGLDADRILQSHERQLWGLAKLYQGIEGAYMVARDEFARLRPDIYDAVIAYGGDNHFLYVSQFVKNALMIGVNSDPATSVGALLSFSPEDAPYIDSCLTQPATSRVSSWTRLQVSIDGHILPMRPLGEVYIGHRNPLLMSRYRLELGQVSEEQKSSGILVATGCGSTGWLYNAVKLWAPGTLPFVVPFDRESPQVLFIVREMGNGTINAGILEPGRPLLIQSMMEEAMLSLNAEAFDPQMCLDFPAGSTATIQPTERLQVLLKSTFNRS